MATKIKPMNIVLPAAASPRLFKSERTKPRKAVSVTPRAEAANPLAAIAGSYASDPNWSEYLQVLEEMCHETGEAAKSVS